MVGLDRHQAAMAVPLSLWVVMAGLGKLQVATCRIPRPLNPCPLVAGTDSKANACVCKRAKDVSSMMKLFGSQQCECQRSAARVAMAAARRPEYCEEWRIVRRSGRKGTGCKRWYEVAIDT